MKIKNTPNVYLICGFLGAGKTTYSKKLAIDTGAIHLNPDEICTQRYTPEEYENNWEDCFAKTLDFLWAEIAKHIQHNKDVIFDSGFWTKESRNEAVSRVKQMGGNPIIHYLYAPDDILKVRIKSRSGKIAEHNILHFDSIKKLFETPSQDEDFITINNF